MNGGFTMIPHEIISQAAEIKPAAFKLLIVLLRETLGWNGKSEVEISYRELSRKTGLSVNGIRKSENEISHIFTSKNEGGKTVWVYHTVTRGVAQSDTGCITQLHSGVAQSDTDYSGLNKDKESSKESVSTLAQHFQSKTGLFYSPALWDSEWEPLLDHWLNQYGDKTRGMIDAALDVAWGKNESGRRYTLKSPMSLQAIMANLDPAKLNGTISIGAR